MKNIVKCMMEVVVCIIIFINFNKIKDISTDIIVSSLVAILLILSANNLIKFLNKQHIFDEIHEVNAKKIYFISTILIYLGYLYFYVGFIDNISFEKWLLTKNGRIIIVLLLVISELFITCIPIILVAFLIKINKLKSKKSNILENFYKENIIVVIISIVMAFISDADFKNMDKQFLRFLFNNSIYFLSFGIFHSFSSSVYRILFSNNTEK